MWRRGLALVLYPPCTVFFFFCAVLSATWWHHAKLRAYRRTNFNYRFLWRRFNQLHQCKKLSFDLAGPIPNMVSPSIHISHENDILVRIFRNRCQFQYWRDRWNFFWSGSFELTFCVVNKTKDNQGEEKKLSRFGLQHRRLVHLWGLTHNWPYGY